METAELIEALAEATAIDLSQPLRDGMPSHHTHPPFRVDATTTFDDFQLPDGYSGMSESVTICGHAGTHIDSLGHAADQGALYGGIPAGEAIRDGALRQLGVEELAPVLCRGVLVDAARHGGVELLPPEAGIGAAELEAILTAEALTVGRGDALLIRTGWGRLWDEPARYLGEGTGVPGLTIDGARWISSRGVRLVGADTLTVERLGDPLEGLPVHRHLLANEGVPLVENLDLERLAALEVTEFGFLCLPLPLHGASGSPVRPLALIASGDDSRA